MQNKKLTWVVQRICHCQIHQQQVDCSVVLQRNTLWSCDAACHCQTSIGTLTAPPTINSNSSGNANAMAQIVNANANVANAK